jgi:nucleotide-binding universal stress UspA family protein
MAEKYGAELHIVSVAKGDNILEKSTPYIEVSDPERPAESRAQKATEDVAEKAEEAGIKYTTAILHGSPSDALDAYIEDQGIDFVVMGGRKQSPTGKMLFGSVTQSLILHNDVPITVL